MSYIEREAALKVLCDACGNAACPKGLIPRCSYYEKMQAIPAADTIEELSKPRWIPVTERLPEPHQYVLCCGRRGGMFVGWVASLAYNGDKKATAFVHGGSGRYITHWMPLPEPPKEE